ncbi:DUF1833 family protein [Tropicimonas sp. S265A]|uniref:DUF1833 family protein n=1 Tax=Tropicimonas sp. S265A TaxID=3415134 RepID=UPI003C7EB6F0
MALSSEERRELALAEAYQHRPSGTQVVLTLQFDHPSFDVPARVVNDTAPLDAMLETGEQAHFIAALFSAALPANGDGRWPEIDLWVDVIGSELEAALDQSLGATEPVVVTAREYIREIADMGPSFVLPALELDSSSTSDLIVRGRAGYFGLDRRFGYTYDPSDYPGIA